MPQFDYTSFTSQIFWLAICFGILYLFAYKLIVPHIENIITLREKTIQEYIKKAEAFAAEAAIINSEYVKRISEAQDKASYMISEAHIEVQKEINKRLAEVDREVADKFKQAEIAATSKRKKAKVDIEKLALDLLVAVSTRLGLMHDKKSFDTAIDKATKNYLGL